MKKEIESWDEALKIVPECKKMTLMEARYYQDTLLVCPEHEMKDRFLKIKAIQFILDNWKQSKQEFKIALDLAHEMKTFGERK